MLLKAQNSFFTDLLQLTFHRDTTTKLIPFFMTPHEVSKSHLLMRWQWMQRIVKQTVNIRFNEIILNSPVGPLLRSFFTTHSAGDLQTINEKRVSRCRGRWCQLRDGMHRRLHRPEFKSRNFPNASPPTSLVRTSSVVWPHQQQKYHVMKRMMVGSINRSRIPTAQPL